MFIDTPVRNSIPEYSVSEISYILKRTMEESFSVVKIKGEISGLRPAASGHLYFNLKDDKSILKTICWKGVAATLPFKPEDGLEVICIGKITTYPARSEYQLEVSKIESAGIGALLAMLEKRKLKLTAEGLFDPKRKKLLPFLPTVIGIVTSPTGAVIRDILHRIRERFPVHVIVWPVLVQGAEAAQQIADAINGFNKVPQNIAKPDLLIVARGGGSIEDLWPFNEEIVVRAAAESAIPLISAVGHETDTTLIDFASDLRAPTPTAAAEIAVKEKKTLEHALVMLGNRSALAIGQNIKDRQTKIQLLQNKLSMFENKLRDLENRIRVLAEKLSYKNLIHRITLENRRLEQCVAMIQINLKHLIGNLAAKLDLNGKLLNSYHYKKVLQRGFTMIWDKQNKALTSLAVAATNSLLQIEFHDGKLEVLNPKPHKKTTKKPENGLQEKLF